jgi:large subunit ribosomal protein L38e
LPTELNNIEHFISLSGRASKCFVKELSDIIKLKIRTKKNLYTLKITPFQKNEIIKKLKCDIVEI